MSKVTELVAGIITELAIIQNATKPAREEDDEFPFPRMIPTGDGRSILISKKIEQLISSVAKRLRENENALATTFSRKDLQDTVHKGFGAALIKIDLDDDVSLNADSVLRAVRKNIEEQISANAKVLDHSFGCTLFGGQTVRSFKISRVRFEDKAEWLDRKLSDGTISKTAHTRVTRVWSGRRLSRRKPSNDEIKERGIIDTVGQCPFVCTVVTDGLAPDVADEKAAQAARLAITSIALLWQTPSKALDGFNLAVDRETRRIASLSFADDGSFTVSHRRSHLPHGPSLKKREWETKFAENAGHFGVIAEALEYYLNPAKKASRPRLMSAVLQSLIWFHEGCRERSPLIAVVKFTASMEALAKGKKETGICRLITARLGIAASQKVDAEGTTLSQAIRQIYRHGRSQTIHGTNDEFGHDWSTTQGNAQQFARYCLMACIDWASEHPEADDPALFSR